MYLFFAVNHINGALTTGKMTLRQTWLQFNAVPRPSTPTAPADDDDAWNEVYAPSDEPLLPGFQ